MKIIIETPRESKDQIYFGLKEKYPELDIQMSLQKSLTTADVIMISLSVAQLATGILALIPVFLSKKNDPKVKITIKDEHTGRVLMLEGEKINETKVVTEFINSLDQ